MMYSHVNAKPDCTGHSSAQFINDSLHQKIVWSLHLQHRHQSRCHITYITHRSSTAWRKETVRKYWWNFRLSHI